MNIGYCYLHLGQIQPYFKLTIEMTVSITILILFLNQFP